jgi:nucleotide-binding universal stress UspA family protein
MFQHLLLAIDDSPSSPVALALATAVARRERASVHVLHANRLLVGGRGFTELTDAEATALVDDAVLQLLEQGIDASGSVSRASSFTIGQVIADAAQDRRCDAIVIGSARRVRRSRLAHPFGRGTREQITRYSALPVLTAPSPLQVPGGRRRHGGATLRSAGRSRTPVVS